VIFSLDAFAVVDATKEPFSVVLRTASRRSSATRNKLSTNIERIAFSVVVSTGQNATVERRATLKLRRRPPVNR